MAPCYFWGMAKSSILQLLQCFDSFKLPKFQPVSICLLECRYPKILRPDTSLD